MKRTTFGRHDGQEIRDAVLEDGPTRIAVLNYGCVIRDWRLDGVPMVLGFDGFEAYPAHSPSFGIMAGRVANRIAGGRFILNGATHQLSQNIPPNHLHGGHVGLGRRVWKMEVDSAARAVQLTYRSPEGEEGYPGAVDFAVTFQLRDGRLICDMTGRPDRPTPINLAQHNYYNLAGAGDSRDHRLQVAADRYLPVSAGLIPTGEIAPVDGTMFDFRTARTVAAADPDAIGHDHNLCLIAGRDPAEPAAELTASGRRLRLWTDQPGLQLYTGSKLGPPVPGLDGQRYGPFAGLCLEAQGWPDAVNWPGFPSIIATPEAPYRQRLEVEIAAF
ncbi:MAG: aldose epimerase family protein [Pseudomonadota bacterium]